MARRRTDLALSQRVEIVQLLDTKKFSQVDLSKRFQCSQSTISDPPPGMTMTEFCAYVDMDVSLSCHGQLSDDEICYSVRETADPETKCCDSDEESEPASMCVSCPKACDAIQAMHTIRKFVDSAGADLCYFYKVESQVLQVAALNTSQTSICDFFSLSSPEY